MNMGDSEKYWVSKDGENMGPLTLDDIRDEIDRSSLSTTDHACEVGADEWLSIGEMLKIPDLEEGQVEGKADGDDESKQIVLKGGSGGSLNTVLTILFALLVVTCSILFLVIKSWSPESVGGMTDGPGDRLPQLTPFDLGAMEKNATDWSDLTVMDALVHKSDGSLFTGWSVAKYANSDQMSNLTRHEKGKSLDGFSWKSNGDRCDKTTLSDGNGILVSFHGNGRTESESPFRQGLWSGNRSTWFKGGQKEEEAQYKNGKLHGRLVSFHFSGQKTKEISYLNGLQDGRYELLTEEGQKYDMGSYRSGKRDGKRSQWSPDGTRMNDETYEDGELVPPVIAGNNPPDISVGGVSLGEGVDPDPSMLFDTSNVGPDLKVVADSLARSAKNVRERFLVANASGHESFSALAVASYRYRVSKGTNLENETLVSLREAFVGFRNAWDMSSGLDEGDGFVLSVLPASVTYGPVTLSREEFGNEPGGVPGNHSLEDFDFILGETRSMFKSVGLELQLDDAFGRKEVSMAIWGKLWEEGKKAESANLFLKNNSLSFSVTETHKKKSLDRNGNSVFTDEEKEIDLSFTTGAKDKKMGRYANVLRSAQAQTEDSPSPQNPKLIIRKFEGIVIRAGTMLYTDVSVMLAGAAPLSDNTLIRGVKVELGEPLQKPAFN
jgi:antitoxin component YwqK of YwqJK toxin-antitoxin module